LAPGKLGIVADDLTGAMDSSGYFASLGYSTVVILDPAYPSAADVVVITTNSRAEDPARARERVTQAVDGLGGRVVYKKIDSTLRGNVGIELEAAMAALKSEKAIVAPAFPAVGRTTVNGVLLVNGVPVAETQFARDPVSPVKESHIPTLLVTSMGRGVATISVKDIEAGADALFRKVTQMPEKVIVADVTEQSHLVGIVQANVRAEGHWLLCGSGGMARELHLFLGKPPKAARAAKSNTPIGPALVVIGSQNQVAGKQLLKAKEELGLPMVNVDVDNLNAEKLAAEASRILAQGKSVAITSTFARYVPELKQSIGLFLADAAINILSKQKAGGLFLSGGDIALAVCQKLGIAAIKVNGEVEAGIPAGELIGGRGEGMRVVTKAGGFGTEQALVKALAYLERKG
jgi:uncharacterized protein YgbK (DUF1537 family)